jgi:hypothetical protein
LAIAWRINGTASVSPNRASRTGIVSTSSGIAVDGTARARHDDVAGHLRVELCRRIQHHAAGPADDRPRPFGGNEFDLQRTAYNLAARGEHFEWCDDIERVAPVEQHNLCVHADMVGGPDGEGPVVNWPYLADMLPTRRPLWMGD